MRLRRARPCRCPAAPMPRGFKRRNEFLPRAIETIRFIRAAAGVRQSFGARGACRAQARIRAGGIGGSRRHAA